MIDGVDLSGRHVGERMAIPTPEAKLLIAEGWAEPVPAEQRRRSDFSRRSPRGDEQCA